MRLSASGMLSLWWLCKSVSSRNENGLNFPSVVLSEWRCLLTLAQRTWHEPPLVTSVNSPRHFCMFNKKLKALLGWVVFGTFLPTATHTCDNRLNSQTVIYTLGSFYPINFPPIAAKFRLTRTRPCWACEASAGVPPDTIVQPMRAEQMRFLEMMLKISGYWRLILQGCKTSFSCLVLVMLLGGFFVFIFGSSNPPCQRAYLNISQDNLVLA